MYYLQSRYYDPELGRFLNVDTYVLTGQGLLGSNMFVYCNNNPTIHSDPTGNIIQSTANPNAMQLGGYGPYTGYTKIPGGEFPDLSFSYSGSVFDNHDYDPENILHLQLLTYELSGLSLSNTGFTLLSLDAAAIAVAFEFGWIDLSLLDLYTFEVDASITNKGVSLGALASVYNPSVTINWKKIKITFTGYLLSAGAGMKFDLSKGIEIYSSAWYGGGVSISWDN